MVYSLGLRWQATLALQCVASCRPGIEAHSTTGGTTKRHCRVALTLALLGGCCRWTVACATSNFGSDASAAAAAATLPCSEHGRLRLQGVAQCRCYVDCLVTETCR
jgi:hypothetical protein